MGFVWGEGSYLIMIIGTWVFFFFLSLNLWHIVDRNILWVVFDCLRISIAVYELITIQVRFFSTVKLALILPKL